MQLIGMHVHRRLRGGSQHQHAIGDIFKASIAWPFHHTHIPLAPLLHHPLVGASGTSTPSVQRTVTMLQQLALEALATLGAIAELVMNTQGDQYVGPGGITHPRAATLVQLVYTPRRDCQLYDHQLVHFSSHRACLSSTRPPPLICGCSTMGCR